MRGVWKRRVEKKRDETVRGVWKRRVEKKRGDTVRDSEGRRDSEGSLEEAC